MNLPAKIIELIEQLPAVLRAHIYYMLIEYMRTGQINTRGIGEHAVREFYVLKPALDRILHRRRKAREYRERRKKNNTSTTGSTSRPRHSAASSSSSTTHAGSGAPAASMSHDCPSPLRPDGMPQNDYQPSYPRGAGNGGMGWRYDRLKSLDPGGW